MKYNIWSGQTKSHQWSQNCCENYVPRYNQNLTVICIGHYFTMMTSSNGNIFRVTGPLCGEFTGPGEFPTQRPVTRSFDVFFDLRLNKPLSKQPWGWWFETLSRSLWRHRNDARATAFEPCVHVCAKPAFWMFILRAIPSGWHIS